MRFSWSMLPMAAIGIILGATGIGPTDWRFYAIIILTTIYGIICKIEGFIDAKNENQGDE